MSNKKENNLIFRINEKEKQKIEENSKKFGFHSVSEYIRYVCVNIKEIKITV